MPRKEHVGHPALTDPETGLANQLHFGLVYGYLFGAGDRGVALTVMLLQVDALDTGEAGARLLRSLGATLQTATRSSDLVAHLGAGRFVVLLMGSNLQGGLLAGDRLQSAVQEVAPGPISVGLAAYSPDMKKESELLEAAEGALKRAREAGGGIEVVHT